MGSSLSPADPLGRAGGVDVRDLLQLVAEGVAVATEASATIISVALDGGPRVVASTGRPGHGSPEVVLRLTDDTGVVHGSLEVYLPQGAPAPDPHVRRMLQVYAEQATRIVAPALERARIAERLRRADTARRLVRRASEHRSLQQLLEAARPALLDGFRAVGLWIQTFDEDGLGRGSVYSADGKDIEITERVYQIAFTVAHTLWANQHAVVLSTRDHSGLLSETEAREVQTFLEGLNLASVLFVPLGAGHRCLGNLVLTREHDAEPWTEDEAASALEIGRDLGVAVHSARSYERERRLVREVQTLEARLHDGPAEAPREPAPETDPDLARTRADLRAASDALEQAGRRRDAQARLVADALALDDAPALGALDSYRTLRGEYRDAHLYWQVAFDAWQEVSARHQQE